MGLPPRLALSGTLNTRGFPLSPAASVSTLGDTWEAIEGPTSSCSQVFLNFARSLTGICLPALPLPALLLAPPKEMPFPASQKAKEISASCLRTGGDEGREDETPENHFLPVCLRQGPGLQPFHGRLFLCIHSDRLLKIEHLKRQPHFPVFAAWLWVEESIH